MARTILRGARTVKSQLLCAMSPTYRRVRGRLAMLEAWQASVSAW